MTSNTQILKVQAMESTDPPTYVEATNVSPTAPQLLNQSHLISVQENVQTTQPLSTASQLNTNQKLPPINAQNTE